jgi:UPF0716 protein FxsA
MKKWPLLFLVWFCVEVLVLVEVGIWIGALDTLALLLASMAIGALMLRAQGIHFIARMAGIAQRHAEGFYEGRDDVFPTRPLADLAPRFLAGVLFLVPGFVSDLVALAILLPPLRGRITRRVQTYLEESRHAANARRRFTTVDMDVDSSDDEVDDGDEEQPHPRLGRRIP